MGCEIISDLHTSRPSHNTVEVKYNFIYVYSFTKNTGNKKHNGSKVKFCYSHKATNKNAVTSSLELLASPFKLRHLLPEENVKAKLIKQIGRKYSLVDLKRIPQTLHIEITINSLGMNKCHSFHN